MSGYNCEYLLISIHFLRFLDMHLYVTSMLQKTDIKAVALQMALDMLHEKEEKDLVTGLNSRINAGRPNWNKVFTKIQEEKKGKVTVFYCGNPMLAKTLRKKCAEFGFGFRFGIGFRFGFEFGY